MEQVKTCTILTTTPNAVTSAIHDRMPVILDAADYDVWLDPGMKDTATAAELLRPFDASAMRCYPVSSRVNNVQNDGAECCQRVELHPPPQSLLFSQIHEMYPSPFDSLPSHARTGGTLREMIGLAKGQ